MDLALALMSIAVIAAVSLLFCAHSVLKIWVVSEVCSRWMEDRRSGALELLLSSPMSVAGIARGQKLALRSQFGKAVGVVLALDLTLLIVVKFLFHDSSAQSLIAAIPAGMIMLVADLIPLRWVAMWLSLTSKSMSQALMGAWLRVLALPWLAYFSVYGTFTLYSQFLGRREPIASAQIWTVLWLCIGLGVDWVFGWRARQRFLDEFRTISSEQFVSRSRISMAQAALRFLRQGSRALGWAADNGQANNGPSFCAAPVAGPWSESRSWRLVGLVVSGLALRQITEELAAIRREGYPVTEAELMKWHPPILLKENLRSVCRSNARL